jgi:hypothetical protein
MEYLEGELHDEETTRKYFACNNYVKLLELDLGMGY